jgi:DNA-binding FadR family transcriptional regulator
VATREVSFQRIEQPRAHEYVAEQVRRQIMLRLVPAGRALPPERDLARMFGVGRATVQRALGLLERDGLVESRRGRTGGTFVVGPVGADGSLRRVLADIRSNRAVIEEALAFRLEVEPAAAAEAAGGRRDDELERMREAIDEAAAAETDVRFMEHDTELHLLIGYATRNRFYADAVERLRVVLNDPLVALPDSAIWHARSTAEHGAVLDALAAGDGEGAREAMLEHVTHTAQAIRVLLQAL